VLGAGIVGSGSTVAAWRGGGLRYTLLPRALTDACGVVAAEFRLGRQLTQGRALVQQLPEQVDVLSEVTVAEEPVPYPLPSGGAQTNGEGIVGEDLLHQGREVVEVVRVVEQQPAFTVDDLVPDATHPRCDHGTCLPHRHGHGQPEAPFQTLLDHHRRVVLEGVDQMGVLVHVIHGQAAQVQPTPLLGTTCRPDGPALLEHLGGLRIVAHPEESGPTSNRCTSSGSRSRWSAMPVSTPAMSFNRSQRLT
jgi:hypothetical protein